MSIREFRDSDWAQIWPVWRAIVEAGETYAYPPDASSDEARSWWIEPPPGRATVFVDDDQVLGTAKMGPNRPGRGSHIATASFMVDPAARGRGVGRALADDMIGWARQGGYHGIQFNAVVETNPATQLWQSLGFHIIGTVPDAFDSASHGLVGLHVMYLPL